MTIEGNRQEENRGVEPITQPETGLITTNQGRMLFALMSIRGNQRRALLTRFQDTADMIRENPGVVADLAPVAYQHPEYFREGAAPRSGLTDIRRDYPAIIDLFTDGRLASVLTRFPHVSDRLREERRLLNAFLPGNTAIKDVEVVLRILIDDGSIRSVQPDSYQDIVHSHNLFGALSAIVDGPESEVGLDETNQFIREIGQRLLRNRRLFELQPVSSADSHYRKGLGERDFQGRIAEIRLFQAAALACAASWGEEDKERAGRFKAAINFMIEEIGTKYPNRRRELGELFGVIDWGLASHFTVEPGEADLSDSERSGLGHNE